MNHQSNAEKRQEMKAEITEIVAEAQNKAREDYKAQLKRMNTSEKEEKGRMGNHDFRYR